MCGIHLIIDKKSNLNQETINSMAAASQHRGPDSTKCRKFSSPAGTIYVGANRLKITDQTESASQPYISSDQKCVLLFNGEIYNFYELKNLLLSKGIRFTSESDTEVLFHWLRIYGINGVKNLKGMFALVFLNLQDQIFFLARDRFGIKPLYYFENENYFIASSEIKAIHSTGLIKKEINTTQLYHYLSYKYAKPPETFYQNIFELQHGTLLSLDKGKTVLKSFRENKTEKENPVPDTEIIESLITDSLLQQINAKVPLGLLLSGGADSTLLLGLAKKEGFQLPTYSIVNKAADQHFGTKDYTYSRLAASLYGSDHHEIEIDFSLANQFDEMIGTMDQPIGDSAYLLTSEVCRYASNEVKILLSGAGADEIFAGYNRHEAFYRYLKHKEILTFTLPLLKPVISLFPTGFSHPLRKKFKHIKKFFESLDRSAIQTYDNFLTFQEMNIDSTDTTAPVKRQSNAEYLYAALQHDQNNYLVSDILALSDKASMLHGIELRVPYLSGDLVDYLHNIPTLSLIKHGRKELLNKILIKYGGEKFARRPKEGFGLPLAPWLEHKKASHLWEVLKTPDSRIFQYINKEKIDKLADRQKRKIEDHGPFLWSVLVLAHWLEQNAE